MQLQPGGDTEVSSELARKHLDRISGIDDAERRAAEAEHLLDLEAVVIERWNVTLRGLEHLDICREAAFGQKRRL